MPAKKLRVYADTSVFGGCFDDEFAEDSKAFFDEVRTGRFTLVVSHVVIRELIDAPGHVRKVLADLPPESVEQFTEEAEAASLSQAYMDAGVVGPASREDAEHVAAASVADVDLIVSWNFRHIVHFEKINGYHGVNLIRGYALVPIYSPKEVIQA